jgi:hypothetical protein
MFDTDGEAAGAAAAETGNSPLNDATDPMFDADGEAAGAAAAETGDSPLNDATPCLIPTAKRLAPPPPKPGIHLSTTRPTRDRTVSDGTVSG